MRMFITEQKLSKLLTNTHKELNDIIYGSRLILVREYKKELPVDKGAARRNTKPYRTNNGYFVVSRVFSKGYNYLGGLYSGSGRFYGKPDAGKHKGRTRAASYSDSQIGLFKFLASLGYRFNRQPNHFSDRAATTAAPLITKFINDKIGKVGNEA